MAQSICLLIIVWLVVLWEIIWLWQRLVIFFCKSMNLYRFPILLGGGNCIRGEVLMTLPLIYSCIFRSPSNLHWSICSRFSEGGVSPENLWRSLLLAVWFDLKRWHCSDCINSSECWTLSSETLMNALADSSWPYRSWLGNNWEKRFLNSLCFKLK